MQADKLVALLCGGNISSNKIQKKQNIRVSHKVGFIKD